MPALGATELIVVLFDLILLLLVLWGLWKVVRWFRRLGQDVRAIREMIETGQRPRDE